MCQAAHLLGKVLRYNQDRAAPVVPGVDEDAEYWQLNRTIQSLLNLSYIEGELRRMAICGQTAICYRYAFLQVNMV